MKKIVILLGIAITVFNSGCNKADNAFKGLLSMDVDGVNWTATNEVGAEILNSTKGLTINGNDDAKKSLSIGLADIDGVGTYDILETSTNSLIFTDGNASPDISYSIKKVTGFPNNSHGTLTITSVIRDQDGLKSVEGTFSGVAYNLLATSPDSIIITNGKFKDSE